MMERQNAKQIVVTPQLTIEELQDPTIGKEGHVNKALR